MRVEWLRGRREARWERGLAAGHALLWALHGWLGVQAAQGRWLYAILGALLYAPTLPWWCAALALGGAAAQRRGLRPLLCASSALLLWLAVRAPWLGAPLPSALLAGSGAGVGGLTLALLAARWLREARARRRRACWLPLR